MQPGLKTLRVLATALLLVCQQVHAQSERIVWAIVDWPPYMILRDGKAPQGPDALGNGVADRLMAEITKRMPEYRHEFQLANVQRLWSMMARGENLCYAVALKRPERMGIAYFTPAFIGPPPALAVHRARRDAITGNADPVSLVKVLHEHGAEGRLESKRAYGTQIDAVIAAHPKAIQLELVPTTGALLRPLSAGLIGFTVEYPATVEYARRTGDVNMPVDTIGISEAQDWSVGYVACTRNAWGKRVIADVDVAVRKAAQSPAYSGAMANWMPKEFAQKNAERMRSFYEARGKAGPDID